MRILPSLISFRPNGGAAQPISIWPVITCVRVAGRAAGRGRLRLHAKLLAERHHDVVRARAEVEYAMVLLGGRVLERLDRRVRLHIPVEIARAGERRQQDAHRRAALERAHRARDADAPAEIGRARDHRLDGLARALRAERFDLQIVLLEDAGVLAERRRLVLPVVDLARWRSSACPVRQPASRRARARSAPLRSSTVHHFLPPLFFFAPRLALADAAFAGAGSRAAASAARSIGSDFPRPSRSANRRTQYS